MRSDPRSTANQKVLWQFAESILPKKRPGDFNQSLMELGSEICKPKTWQCEACPIQKICPTFVKGLQATIPASGKKIAYEDLHEAALLVSKNVAGIKKWLVRLCGPDERWTGLWDFPRFEIDHRSNNTVIATALAKTLETKMGIVTELESLGTPMRHAVTKYRIRLRCFESTSVKGRLKKQPTETRWCSASALAKLPMSVTGRKIVEKYVAGISGIGFQPVF